MSYITYAHYKPNGDIFYIGKGTTSRAYSKQGRNIVWKRTVEKYKSFDVKILCEWPTEDEAFQHEILLIDCFRDMGVQLANIAKGGMGSAGFRHTENHKKNLSSRMKLNNPMFDDEIRKKQLTSLKNAMNRPEIKKKQSQNRIGMKFSESHIKSLQNCHPMRPCVINGIEYKSLMEASRILNIRHGTLYRWLNNPNVVHNKKFKYITECRWK